MQKGKVRNRGQPSALLRIRTGLNREGGHFVPLHVIRRHFDQILLAELHAKISQLAVVLLGNKYRWD